MSKLNITPGPWKATIYTSIVGCVITAQPDKTKNQFNICSVHGGETKQEVEANARLIAAAPEMLAALKRFEEEYTINGTPAQKAVNYSIELQISEAIKKATK